jgi:uncharacterized protein (UPF0335 family)
LDPRAQEAAFGAPGEPGDADRIIHLARRLASVYEEFMDVAADLRATGVSSKALRRVLDIEARWADQPIEQIRTFVDRLVSEMDGLAERLQREESIAIEMTIKLEMSSELSREHVKAMKDYQKERRRARH